MSRYKGERTLYWCTLVGENFCPLRECAVHIRSRETRVKTFQNVFDDQTHVRRQRLSSNPNQPTINPPSTHHQPTISLTATYHQPDINPTSTRYYKDLMLE